MSNRERNVKFILEGLNEGKSEMTKEKFLDYVRIQMSGVTNMFDVRTVCMLSDEGLTKDDCLDIMKNYNTYYKKWVKNKGIKENIDEGFTFRPYYGVCLLTNFGDLRSGTLFYCDSIDNTNKTVKLVKQDDKKYELILPISFAQSIFTDSSGLERGKAYTLKKDMRYALVDYGYDNEWSDKYIEKYTKGEWIVFPKGTKFWYQGSDKSGDEFLVDSEYVKISDVEILDKDGYKGLFK